MAAWQVDQRIPAGGWDGHSWPLHVFTGSQCLTQASGRPRWLLLHFPPNAAISPLQVTPLDGISVLQVLAQELPHVY